MRLLALTPERFWPADGLQEAHLTVDEPGVLEVRGRAGTMRVEVAERESAVVLPSGADVTELDVRTDDGEWERRPWVPGRRWDIVVMPTGHVDIYSTETYDKTPEEHAAMLDTALDLCARHDDYRYQVENLLAVVEHRALRPRRAGELTERLRDGRIGVGAQSTGLHHGEATGEELVQAQLALGRRLGVAPNCGYTCDVPAATGQYRQLLARLGIPRWIYSPNRFPAPEGFYGVAELLRRLPTLGRVYAPDGSAVTTWIPAVHYGEDPALFGLTAASVEEMRGAIDARLAVLEVGGRPGDVYPLEASAGDNLPPLADLPALVAAWQDRYAWPRVRFGTAADVFDAVEAAESDLPGWGGEIGDTWAWVVANQAALNAVVRDAVRDAVGAEVAAATAGGPHPDAADDALAQAAKYESHDWWYAGEHVRGIPDLAKAEFARAAREAAARAVATTAGTAALLNTSGVAHAAIVAHSGGGGQRVPAALADAHFDARAASPALPTQEAPEGDAAAAVVSVRELAPFEAVVCDDGSDFAVPSEPLVETGVLESAHYRVVLGPAGIVSLVDRAQGRDLAAAPLARLQVGTPQSEATGMGFGGSREQATKKMRASLTSWVDGAYEPGEAWSGPVFSAAVWKGRVHDSPASLAVVLYEHAPRVDVTVSVDWNGQPWFARLAADFDFAVGDAPEARYEVPFGSVRAGDESPIGPATLRMAGRWVSFAGSDAAVVIASRDCGVVAIGDPRRNLADLAVPDRPARARASFVLADTGAPSPLVQGGRLVGRFSLTSRSAPFRPGEATAFAAGAIEPVLPVSAPAAGWRISPAGVVPSVLKPEWNGPGVVLRLVECDGNQCDVDVVPPFTVGEVLDARPDETPLGRITFPLCLAPHEVRTLIFRRVGSA